MKKLLPGIILILIISAISSQNLQAQNYKDQITVQSDNDQYINPNHDRYYTDGTIITFTHATKIDTNGKLAKKLVEFRFGQQIYNPSTGHIYKFSLFDRPFTGYLLGSVGFNWLYKNEDALKVTAELGTIGPNAFGKQVQTSFHKFFGLYPVGPWDKYQLNNELGLNIDVDYKKLLYRNTANWFDLAFNPEVRLGNTFTYANVGMQLRFGNFGKFYESEGTNSRVSSTNKEQKHYEFYFFAEPQFSYVAYNATIEGGLFTDNPGPYTFGIYHILFIQQLGLQYSSDRWSANYIAYIRTREVKSTALGDQYGSISIAYRFGKM